MFVFSLRHDLPRFGVLICAVLAGIFFSVHSPVLAWADSNIDVFFDDEGNLVMTSNDKAAHGAVSYRTVGWTLKKEDKPVSETKSARVNQVEYSREPAPGDPDRVITTYKVSEDKLFDRIKKCDADWAKELYRDGGTVYLDAIMTVVYNETPSGGINADGSIWGTVYFTAASIKSAENWADPDSLDSHFGKRAYFEGDKKKLWGRLKVEYYEVTGDDIDSARPLDFLEFDRDEDLEDKVYIIEAEDLSDYELKFTYSTISCITKEGLTTKYGGQHVYNVDNSNFKYESVTVRFYFEEIISTKPYSYTYGKEFVTEKNRACLQAVPLGDPEFDVETRVPSGEKLCAVFNLQKYYMNIDLTKYSGKRFVSVEVRIWSYSDSGTYREKKKKVYVSCEYSYFRIDNVKIFEADTAVIENGALPDDVRFEDIPDVNVICRTNRGSYVRTPEEPDVAYISEDEYKEGGKEVLLEAAEWACSGPGVRNDLLSVDGHIFLNGAWCYGCTSGFSAPEGSAETTLYREDILIPETVENGGYTSRAYVTYKRMRIKQNGELYYTGAEAIHYTKDVNGIFVHTPVVCVARCTDDISGNQQYEKTVHKSLVLGREFTLSISEVGQNADAKGYGYRDYSKYSGKKQVRLPFPVYYGEKYVLPYTWVTLPGNSAVFYLPVGVEEGNYEVEYRMFAVNCPAIDPADGSLAEKLTERRANKNSDFYIADDMLTVTVTGRMYDLAVTDVEDHPGWSEIFNRESGMNVKYRIGRLSMEGDVIPGRVRDPILPVMTKNAEGPSISEADLKIPGAGYRVRFELKTIGSMRGEKDGIVMLPKYFHISGDGRCRTEVRLYSGKDLSPVYTPVTLTSKDRNFLPVYTKNVTDRQICERSIQLWSGSFRLPDDIYAVPVNVDLSQYIAGKAGRIKQSDSIFLKGGYILVQFEILSVSDGSVNLSYINAKNASKGCCNMWKRQGFAYERRFADGIVFNFADGDLFLFDMEKTINADYESFGTH